MVTLPVSDLAITNAFGPHLSASTLGTSSDNPDRLVKTHCCFCGQQCGIQLKVRQNQVIGFEPWEDFPFNRGMLCPKGVKRYLVMMDVGVPPVARPRAVPKAARVHAGPVK
jgi:assimilatory nitrate reductase catalytic subunit